MPPTKAPLWLQYLIVLGITAGTWLTTTLTQNTMQFDSLTTQKALGSLLFIVVAWLVGCGVHWKATGDPTPINAQAVAGELVPVPPAPPVVVNNYYPPLAPPLPPAP